MISLIAFWQRIWRGVARCGAAQLDTERYGMEITTVGLHHNHFSSYQFNCKQMKQGNRSVYVILPAAMKTVGSFNGYRRSCI